MNNYLNIFIILKSDDFRTNYFTMNNFTSPLFNRVDKIHAITHFYY